MIAPPARLGRPRGTESSGGSITLRAGAHRAQRIMVRAAVAEEIPAWLLTANVGREPALIIAMVPLANVRSDRSDRWPSLHGGPSVRIDRSPRITCSEPAMGVQASVPACPVRDAGRDGL